MSEPTAMSDYGNRIICACGHEHEHHKWNPDDPLDVPWRQYTATRKSYWMRYCRGHLSYDTTTGSRPCRCDGYRPVREKDYVYTRTGRSKQR